MKKIIIRTITLLFAFLMSNSTVYSEEAIVKVKLDGHIARLNAIVRNVPSIEGTQIGKAFIGTKVYIRKKTKNKYILNGDEDFWYFCINQSGERGWIHGAYLKEGGFDFQEFMKGLVGTLDTPILTAKVFKKLKAGWWNSCSEKEWNESPSCAFGGLFFDDNYFYFSRSVVGNDKKFGQINFLEDMIFKIVSYSKNEKKLNLVGKLIINSLSWDVRNNFSDIKITVSESKDYIEVDGTKYFNAYNYNE